MPSFLLFQALEEAGHGSSALIPATRVGDWMEFWAFGFSWGLALAVADI